MNRRQSADWLKEVETSVQRTQAVLMQPSIEKLVEVESELRTVVSRLEAFCASPEAPVDNGNLVPRLWELRRQVLVLAAMVRQAFAFYCGMEQADSSAVVGYSAAGLERAL
jgi:hypothetical protein